MHILCCPSDGGKLQISVSTSKKKGNKSPGQNLTMEAENPLLGNIEMSAFIALINIL